MKLITQLMAEDFDLSRLDPSHPAYGHCPQCNSNNTLSRELTPCRICLTCGYTEDFQNFKQALIAWKPQT